MQSVIKPKTPSGQGWVTMPPPPAWVTMGFPGMCFFHPDSRLSVISAVEVADDGPGSIRKGPEYHISISKAGLNDRPMRCSGADALWVVMQFDLMGAEEDNHVPDGVVRNYWRPVAEPLIGIECACKEDEPAIVQDGGDFIWRGVTK